MKLSLVLAAFLATGAIAVPSSSERMAARLERRRDGRQSKPNKRIVESSFKDIAASNTSHVTEYSSNWAGAVLDSYPSGTFKSVTGTFIVPTPTGNGAAAAWVGIDGDTCQSSLLQTGVDFEISNGAVSYSAWYEWYPAASFDFPNLEIKAGHTITLTITASSTTAGTAVIMNESTGQKASQSLTSADPLCQQNAEWIVEDFEQGGRLVPFANFGTVTFTGVSATTESGESVNPSGATVMDIAQEKVLTSVSTTSSSVTISYV